MVKTHGKRGIHMCIDTHTCYTSPIECVERLLDNQVAIVHRALLAPSQHLLRRAWDLLVIATALRTLCAIRGLWFMDDLSIPGVR